MMAQTGDRMERIRALKTAYITNALELTPGEAQKFWPIYNTYNEKIKQLKFGETHSLYLKIKNVGGIDNLSEKEADEIASTLAEIDFKMAKEKQTLYKNLIGVISSKKIIKLFKAEQGFGKELLKQYRDKRRGGMINDKE